MDSPFLYFISLTWPIVFGIIIIIFAFFIHKGSPGFVVLGIEPLVIKIPIKRLFIVRSIMVIMALSLFTKPAFTDYSIYFPSFYFMDVYFDDDGIIQALTEFNKEEIGSMNISNNWKDKKKKYFQKINNDLLLMINIDNFFTPSGKYIHSNGESTMISEKIKGWQQYHIVKSYGFLEHYVELPNESVKVIKSEFSLADTKDNYISLSLQDIYLKYTKIIKPQYKQRISTMPGDQSRTYHHCLINMTKLTFLPFIKISKTIYLIKDDDDVHLVPIGYAIYRPK